MANLTSRELTAIEEQLGQEEVLIKKYNMYSAMATDMAIKNKCSEIAQKHQYHYNTLLSQLN